MVGNTKAPSSGFDRDEPLLNTFRWLIVDRPVTAEVVNTDRVESELHDVLLKA